jgi:hypothetical protein
MLPEKTAGYRMLPQDRFEKQLLAIPYSKNQSEGYTEKISMSFISMKIKRLW